MHMRNFLPAFGMTTGLAIHSGWWTSLMNPACSSFSISRWMNSWHSRNCFWTFYLTDLTPGRIASRCSITSLGTPGMSEGCHAKISTFAQRKVTSVSSYLAPRPPSMRAVWEGLAPIYTIFMETCPALLCAAVPPEVDVEASGLPAVFISASRGPELMVGAPWVHSSCSWSGSWNPPAVMV